MPTGSITGPGNSPAASVSASRSPAALANEPALVLADEPTGELDRATSRQVLALFQSLNAEGTTLMVATHDLELAAGARRRIEIVDGKAIP